MSNLLTDITIQAVQLPRHQRLALAGFLLDLDDSEDTDVEAARDAEIRSRIQAFDSGQIEADEYAYRQKEIPKRFQQ